jgi:hypothetical protein
VLNLDVLIEKGAISPKDRHLFRMTDSVDEAFTILQSELTEHHVNTPDKQADAEKDDAHFGPEIAKTR